MKTMNTLALTAAALALVGTSHAQTTRSNAAPSTTTSSLTPTGRSMSIRDNPGTLGHSFGEINYSWVDFSRNRDVDADGYILGASGNLPVAPGFDVGLGYNYYRENGHRNPFTGTDFDARYHQLNAGGTLFAASGRVKPFLNAGVGYQWSRGDIQRLRTFDDMWLWNATAGVEVPLGLFSLTPRVAYTDAFDDNGIGTWHYGGQLHHWFSETLGGFVDVAFHEPRENLRTDAWTYTAGLRFRF